MSPTGAPQCTSSSSIVNTSQLRALFSKPYGAPAPSEQQWREAYSEDVVFEDNGVTVLVDPKSLAYIEGTQLDFVREGLNEGFKFNNPNERDRCGCGESFRV